MTDNLIITALCYDSTLKKKSQKADDYIIMIKYEQMLKERKKKKDRSQMIKF